MASQDHSRSCILGLLESKPIRYFMSLYNLVMLALTVKVPKIWRPKVLKIIFQHPTVVWGPLATEPPRISAWTFYRLKVESVSYIFAAESMGLSSLTVRSELRKTHNWHNKVRNDRWRSSDVDDFCVNWKGLCNFLLVINSNLGPISHRFWDTATYWLKIAKFRYSISVLSKNLRVFPLHEISEVRLAKIWATGKINYKCNKIPGSSTYMITMQQHHTRQTDGRHAIAWRG